MNALLAAAATNFVDFAFKAALKASYGRDEMAAVLGTFNLVSEAVVLGLQLFVTGRMLERFGIRAALEARPAALLALAPLAAVAGVAPAAGVKLTETVLRMAVTGSVSDLLLAPTPQRMRTRVKLFAKSAAAPLGSLASGLALSIFGAAGPSRVALAALIGGTAALACARSSASGAPTRPRSPRRSARAGSRSRSRRAPRRCSRASCAACSTGPCRAATRRAPSGCS